MRLTRGGVVQWENPVSPTINVPLQVERRVELRSGGDVPSTLVDGNPAAPGEPTKGFTSNTVKVDVTGAWGATATHSTDRAVEYRHARNAVAVQKTPIGVRSPGSPFDYTLTVTNTGDRDIIDPVITDQLPYDVGLGTLVQFDPDADVSTDRYTFETSGPSSATNPMPTTLGGAAGVTVAEDLDSATPTIGFTFPAGTVLAQGQTYTITFPMMFVPGVVEGQPVVNSFDVSGDRVWDACTAPSGHTAQLLNQNTECSTNAEVTPQRLPSIRGTKSVRAINPAGGFNNHGFVDADACENFLDSDGFAFQSCVPRTMPGQAEEWRLTLTNNGTTPLTRMVVADLLPVPGDETIMAGFVRNSQWSTVLTDAAPSMAGIAGTMTPYVTTAPATAACVTNAVNTPTDAGLANCIDAAGGDAEAATKFVPFDAVSDHAAVTTLLFVIEPPAGEFIEPGAVINLHFITETGPFSVQNADDPQAFNSLTVSALYPRTSDPGSSLATMSARDQSRAGVALITGSISIEKTISGAGAGFVPDDQVFAGTLHCTSAGQAIPDRDFTVVAGTPTVIDHLPAGAECTATETSASGQTSYTATTVIVPEGDDPATMPAILVNNVYELTELEISKTVFSDAELVPTGFEFSVECVFLGQPIALDPADATFTLNDGGTHTITGLPVNATCTVTETNDRDADSVNVEAETLDADGDAWGVVTENNPGSNAVIDRLAPQSGTNSAEFTNTYGDSAAVRVEKELVGGASDLAESLRFNVNVVCVFSDEVLLDETLELHAGNGWGTTLSSLVAGSECTITEPNLNGADAVVITPNDGAATDTGVVTIPTGATAPVLVNVSNRYLAGSLEVTKAITGEGAALYGTGDFTVELVCTLDGDPVRVIDGAERTLNADNLVANYTGLPSGANCTLTETSNAGATESTIRLEGDVDWVDAADPGVSFTVNVDASIASNDDLAQTPVELENRFDLAEVSVTKAVVSDAVDQEGTPLEYGPFEVALSCIFEGEAIDILDGAVRVIENGEVVTWGTLPAGAQCAVEETVNADATETWFEQAGVDPDADSVRVDGQLLEFAPLAAIGSGVENVANLFNAFESSQLSLLKSLVGSGSDRGNDKRFEVELVCVLTDATRPDGEEVWNATYALSAANNWRVDIAGLARGAECTVTETERGEADATQIRVGDVTSNGNVATFTADDEQIAVSVLNTFHALSVTGSTAAAVSALLAALLMLGGAVFAATSRRKRVNGENG
ncbi:MAG: hypothetical protein GX862_00920 [Leucobacter sp.]|nr:hypothetical protein [Leucobacter sp.]